MAQSDQLGRQWKIIRTLISSKSGKSAADLAEELECHPRTVYLLRKKAIRRNL
jgi:hypothetical protein